jgi:surfactin synthase thioesterase subunit
MKRIPLRVITASEGPASAEKNQSAWLKLSSDAQQTTLAGGHDLVEENTEGVVAEIRKLLDSIED